MRPSPGPAVAAAEEVAARRSAAAPPSRRHRVHRRRPPPSRAAAVGPSATALAVRHACTRSHLRLADERGRRLRVEGAEERGRRRLAAALALELALRAVAAPSPRPHSTHGPPVPAALACTSRLARSSSADGFSTVTTSYPSWRIASRASESSAAAPSRRGDRTSNARPADAHAASPRRRRRRRRRARRLPAPAAQLVEASTRSAGGRLRSGAFAARWLGAQRRATRAAGARAASAAASAPSRHCQMPAGSDPTRSRARPAPPPAPRRAGRRGAPRAGGSPTRRRALALEPQKPPRRHPPVLVEEALELAEARLPPRRAHVPLEAQLVELAPPARRAHAECDGRSRRCNARAPARSGRLDRGVTPAWPCARTSAARRARTAEGRIGGRRGGQHSRSLCGRRSLSIATASWSCASAETRRGAAVVPRRTDAVGGWCASRATAALPRPGAREAGGARRRRRCSQSLAPRSANYGWRFGIYKNHSTRLRSSIFGHHGAGEGGGPLAANNFVVTVGAAAVATQHPNAQRHRPDSIASRHRRRGCPTDVPASGGRGAVAGRNRRQRAAPWVLVVHRKRRHRRPYSRIGESRREAVDGKGGRRARAQRRNETADSPERRAEYPRSRRGGARPPAATARPACAK